MRRRRLHANSARTRRRPTNLRRRHASHRKSQLRNARATRDILNGARDGLLCARLQTLRGSQSSATSATRASKLASSRPPRDSFGTLNRRARKLRNFCFRCVGENGADSCARAERFGGGAPPEVAPGTGQLASSSRRRSIIGRLGTGEGVNQFRRSRGAHSHASLRAQAAKDYVISGRSRAAAVSRLRRRKSNSRWRNALIERAVPGAEKTRALIDRLRGPKAESTLSPSINPRRVKCAKLARSRGGDCRDSNSSQEL